MFATFWLALLVKALSTALLVVFASAAAEALGPFWGAVIASLPVSAGPAYVFLAMQHGDAFVAASALSSLVANASTGLFLTIYGVMAAKVRPFGSLGIAIAAWLAASLVTRQVVWTPSTALVLNLVVYAFGFAIVGTTAGPKVQGAPASRQKWYELPARALAVAGFVCAVIAASAALGPEATGIAAVFPISLISLIVIVRSRLGGFASSLLAASALRAMLGFGLMLLTLHLTVRPCGAPMAFVIALGVSVFWSVGLLVLQHRRRYLAGPFAQERGPRSG